VARKVAEDHTVSWDGNRWGVPREEVCAGLRGAQVEIERRLDGSHWLSLPRPLSAHASLPGTGAASSIEGPKECSSAPSMTDISIWQKTGHFYFALTGFVRVVTQLKNVDARVPS
jgi:hypothetical protein